MQHPAEHSPLGKSSDYVATYSPGLLFPIPRAPKWAELGLTAETLPYQGVDLWNCYELSWLLPSGKPVVAIGEFEIPADSPSIIESKSFKLYLNSLNQSVFESREALAEVMSSDLSAAAGKPVKVRDGRFGPYVTDGETNASLQRGDTPETMTDQRANELLSARRAREAEDGPKKATKKTAKKKAAKKKATKPKKTTKRVVKAKKR